MVRVKTMAGFKATVQSLCVIVSLLSLIACISPPSPSESSAPDDVHFASPTSDIDATATIVTDDDGSEDDSPAASEPSPVPELGADGEPFTIECGIELPPGPPLLESWILWSDAIVRARLTSSKPSYRIKDRVPGDRRLEVTNSDTYRYTDPYPDAPEAPTKLYWYYPVTIFEFDVLEYLKGSGPSKVRMVDLSGYRRGVSTSCGKSDLYFATKEEALRHAPGSPPRSRNDAILFLNRVTPVEEHERTLFLRRDPDESTDGTSGPPGFSGDQEFGWFQSVLSQRIPLGESSDSQIFEIDPFENYRGVYSTGRVFVDDPNGESGPPNAIDFVGEMNVAELRWWVSQLHPIETKARNEEDFPALADCLSQTWYSQRFSNAMEDHPWIREVGILSGLPAGNRVFGSRLDSPLSEKSVLSSKGQESAFFETEDTLNRHSEYVLRVNVKRPMPAGRYELELSYKQQMCGITSRHYRKILWNVEVVAPPYVLHEAIFDPGRSANGDYGYDYKGTGQYVHKALGKFDPQSFTLPKNGRKISVERLVWNEDTIEFEVQPHAELDIYDLGIIGLDGKTLLTLPFGSASLRDDGEKRYYVWDYCDQPWSDGDKLMVRIRDPVKTKPLEDYTYPSKCQPSDNTGQVNPEISPTPIPQVP